MKKTIAIILIAILCLNYTSCFENKSVLINYPLDLEPVSLDPCKANDYESRQIAMNIFQALTAIDDKGEVIPAGAKSWSISEDKKQYTFEIDPLNKWEDGKEVTAADYCFSIKRMILPQTKAPYATQLFCLVNAKEIYDGKKDSDSLGARVEGNRLILTLTEPYPDFLRVCATQAFYPCNEEYFEETAGKYGLEPDAIRSNGQYYVRIWNHGENIRLSLNKHHKNFKTAKVTNVLLNIGKEHPDIIGDLENERVSLARISAEQAKALDDKKFTISVFEDTTMGLYMNTNDSILKNQNIRRALVSGIERESFIVLKDTGLADAEGIIPISSELDGKLYRETAGYNLFSDFNQQTAVKYLEDARKDLKIDQSKAISITLICPNDKNTVSMLEYVLQSWQKYLSLYVTLEPLDAEKFAERIRNKSFQLAYYRLRGSDESPMSVLERFRTENVENITGYSSSKFNTLLDSAEKANDSEQLEKIKQCEKYLFDSAVFYPIAYELRYYAKLKKTPITAEGFDRPVIFR